MAYLTLITMAATHPVREESFNGKEEVDEAQHASTAFAPGNDKGGFSDKNEDLDVGAQVRDMRCWLDVTDCRLALLPWLIVLQFYLLIIGTHRFGPAIYEAR